MNQWHCKRLVAIPVLCVLACSACGRKEDSAASSPPPEPVPTPAVSPGERPVRESITPAGQAQVEALLSGLTQQVRKYGMEQRRVPANLEELVAAGYLPSVPAAPPGKKFAINKNLEVYVADR